ncbi:MAG: sortase [Nocardioides sp.]|nr:sortase [Nocardioides sp.]
MLGLLLVAVGTAVLGWVGWQYWGTTGGTTWVSHRQQDQVVSELEQQWQSGAEQARTEHGVTRAVVRIPAFGAAYEVPVLEGVSDDALAAGYGHFEGTAGPGQPGNDALAAHRATHGEPLQDLPSLQVGDEIVVQTREAKDTYAQTTGGTDLTVPFTQTWMLTDRPVNPAAGGVTPALGSQPHLITLTTCPELFRTDDRSIAFGTPVDVEPRA